MGSSIKIMIIATEWPLAKYWGGQYTTTWRIETKLRKSNKINNKIKYTSKKHHFVQIFCYTKGSHPHFINLIDILKLCQLFSLDNVPVGQGKGRRATFPRLLSPIQCIFKQLPCTRSRKDITTIHNKRLSGLYQYMEGRTTIKNSIS